jgi:hypothetical protein
VVETRQYKEQRIEISVHALRTLHNGASVLKFDDRPVLFEQSYTSVPVPSLPPVFFGLESHPQGVVQSPGLKCGPYFACSTKKSATRLRSAEEKENRSLEIFETGPFPPNADHLFRLAMSALLWVPFISSSVGTDRRDSLASVRSKNGVYHKVSVI